MIDQWCNARSFYTLRFEPGSKIISQASCAPFLDALGGRALFPVVEFYFVRVADVFLERRFHRAPEWLAEHDHVDLAVVQEAADVEVGRADGGPEAIDHRGLRMQHRTFQLEDAHARLQQVGVERTP